mmetsp:Transcript_45501/g.71305  ORF Transcript_45501/g.71305 Transcript_45501/m.71305 type:complete len:132 (+) Transcript_45501:3-398(+)
MSDAAAPCSFLRIDLFDEPSAMDQGTDEWSMSVLAWVKAESGQRLKHFRDSLLQELGTDKKVEARPFRPHMSLLYGVLPYNDRVHEAEKLAKSGNWKEGMGFEMKTVKIMDCNGGFEGIKRWRELGTVALE